MRKELNRARQRIMKLKCHFKGHDWSKFKKEPRGGLPILYQYCKRCHTGRVDFFLSLEKTEQSRKKHEAVLKQVTDYFRSMEHIEELEDFITYHVRVSTKGLTSYYAWKKVESVQKGLQALGIKAVISSLEDEVNFTAECINVCPRWQCGGMMKQVEEDDWQTPVLVCENCGGKYRFVPEE